MLDEKGFDLWANGYVKTVQVSGEENSYPFAGYKRVLAAVYEAVRESGAASVLDVGFGTGVLSKKLYDDGLSVTGIDFSQRMIELAQAKMPDAKLIQHDFANGLPAQVKASRYDAIISTYALHHLQDADKAEMLRQLVGLLALNFGQPTVGQMHGQGRMQHADAHHGAVDDHTAVGAVLQGRDIGFAARKVAGLARFLVHAGGGNNLPSGQRKG